MRYDFANCSLDTDQHRLVRDGERIPVEPQVFDLLCLLLESAGQTVTTDRLVEVIWQGRAVSDSAISARIAAARKAVGDDGKAQAVIRTISRRGLQMVAEVSRDTPKAPIAEATPDQLNIRFTRATDGASLAYAVFGNGPPLLFELPFPRQLDNSWADPQIGQMLREVGHNNTVLCYDMRGGGLSDPGLKPVGSAQLSDDMISVADAAGMDRFGLLGVSGNCFNAIHVAARHPDRVTRMVLMGGYVDGRSVRNGAPVPADSDSIGELIREGWKTPGSAYVQAYLAIYYPDTTPEILRRWTANLQAVCTPDVMVAHRNDLNTYSVGAFLSQVQAPTLVLHARDDAVHQVSEGRKLASGIPGAEFQVLPTGNHHPLPGFTGWGDFYAAATGFLNRGG